MSLFDKDITTSPLKIGQGFDVHIEFIRSTWYDLNQLFYSGKLWKYETDKAIPWVCNLFKEVSLDMLSVWIQESKQGLTRSLRRFLEKHYLRHGGYSSIILTELSPNMYQICFKLPVNTYLDRRSGKNVTNIPEINVVLRRK